MLTLKRPLRVGDELPVSQTRLSLYCGNKYKHFHLDKKKIVSVNKSTEQAALEHTEEDKWRIQEVTTSLAAAKDISVIATVAIHDVASRHRGGKPGAVATCRYKNLIGQLDSRFTHHQVLYVKNVFYALVTCWIFKLKPSIFGERLCYCSLFSWNKFLPLSSEVPAVSSSCGVLPSVLLSNLAIEKVETPWKQSKNK